jgi:hypothetical protein
MTAPAALPDLGAYRRFVVAFIGGKDSLAAMLHLLSLGVPAHAIELHHHDVDGHGLQGIPQRSKPRPSIVSRSESTSHAHKAMPAAFTARRR